jgi:hypothetical protein
MSRISVGIALTCCVWLTRTVPAAGQPAREWNTDLSSGDTAVVRPVLHFIVTRLSHHIARAATDTTAQPWSMSFPSSASPWPMVESHLRTALRARARSPADSQYYELKVGPLRVSGDTARVHLAVGFTQICRASGLRGGYENTEEVYLFRFQQAGVTRWSSARSDAVVNGDRFGCRPRRN